MRKQEYNRYYVSRWKLRNPDKQREYTVNRKARFNHYLSTKNGYAAHKAGALNTRAKRQGIKGKVNKNDVLNVLKNNKCANCNEETSLEIDHKLPLFMGGKNNRNNLILLCTNCHKIKTKIERQNKAYQSTIPTWVVNLHNISTEVEQLSFNFNSI